MKFHLIGIKGSGMASIAAILHDLGHVVQGSDTEKYVFTQEGLMSRGIKILPFNEVDYSSVDAVIAGHSFFPDHMEVKSAESLGKTVYEYHHFLQKIASTKHSIAVCGSHGKTGTTGVLAGMFEEKEGSYLIGDGEGKYQRGGANFIYEACEYKRHFLAYEPNEILILNIDYDHSDYFKSREDYLEAFQQFAIQAKDILYLNGDDVSSRQIKTGNRQITFGLSSFCECTARKIKLTKIGIQFDWIINDKFIGTLQSKVWSNELLTNILGSLAIAYNHEISLAHIQKTLLENQGVKRRFQETIINDDVYIDDYAHHPTQISLTIQEAKRKYPEKTIIAIFQPDRYSRILTFHHDIAKALSYADDAYLMPFPATAKNDTPELFDVSILLKDQNTLKLIRSEADLDQLVQTGPCVYLVMSSKDVSKIIGRIQQVKAGFH